MRVLDVMVTTLDELISIQHELIQMAERKKTLLIERKVDELNQLSQDEAKLVKQLGQLEESRNQQVETLLIQHPSLTIRQFVETIEDEHVKTKLNTQINTLQQLVLELQAKNKINDQLIKDSLRFVHHMIDQITQSKQQQFNYQSPLQQQKSQTSSQGFFDTKA